MEKNRDRGGKSNDALLKTIEKRAVEAFGQGRHHAQDIESFNELVNQ